MVSITTESDSRRTEFIRLGLVRRYLRRDWLLQHPADWPDELARCRDDCVHFIRSWAWTYDPRNLTLDLPTDIPLHPLPRQEKMIQWLVERIQQGEDGLIEKSRDEGVSWIVVAGVLVWFFVFSTGFAAGVGSRKEELVDNLNDPDALFPKIRYQLDHLPPELQPKYTSAFRRLTNDDNGASITGEAGDQIGRGGRKTVYYLDEHAFIPRADLIDRALSQNARSIIRASTPNGQGNAFYKHRFAGRMPVFTMHWRDNPLKGEEWYARECARLGGDTVSIAQEIDIDYSASVEGVVIPAAWVRVAVGFRIQPGGIGTCGYDVAGSGSAQNVVVTRWGPLVTDIDAWQGSDDVPASAYRAAEIAEANGVTRLSYDCVGIGAAVGGTVARRNGGDIRCIPVNGGAAPEDMYQDDAPELSGKERFANLRAQLWWSVRERFRKTHAHIVNGEDIPFTELISIPADETLISQLSQPTVRRLAAGKVAIEGKQDMQRRGVASPDHADALVYAYATDILQVDAPVLDWI